MTMYIRSAACLSPAFSLEGTAGDFLASLATNGKNPVGDAVKTGMRSINENRLAAIEPDYSRYVDAKMIRRMSRIVKMGVATAMRCLQEAGNPEPGAIITGTAYGCLEDTGIFLRKMIGNKEELLSPTAFIQSTHNTVGAQVALLLKCHAYNNCIVHRAFSLEHSLTEAGMLLAEGTRPVLVGAIDEITSDSFALLQRFGLFRKQNYPAAAVEGQQEKQTLVNAQSLCGEGAAFFLLQPESSGNDLACIEQVFTRLNIAPDKNEIARWTSDMLQRSGIASEAIGTVLDGSNGLLLPATGSPFAVARYIDFKPMCGEFPTASGFALWLAAVMCRGKSGENGAGKKILVFNRSADGHGSILIVSPC